MRSWFKVTPAPAPQPGEPGPGVERHTSNVVVPQTGCGVKRVQETSLRILTTDGVRKYTYTPRLSDQGRVVGGAELGQVGCGGVSNEALLSHRHTSS